jgi:hypothetical protein
MKFDGPNGDDDEKWYERRHVTPQQSPITAEYEEDMALQSCQMPSAEVEVSYFLLHTQNQALCLVPLMMELCSL